MSTKIVSEKLLQLPENKQESGNLPVSEIGTKPPGTEGVSQALVPAKTKSDTKAIASKTWKWDQAKKKAVDMVVHGWPVRKIAKEIGVSPNTVQRWKGHKEFAAAVIEDAREYVSTTRYRRAYETGIITNSLATQVAKHFDLLAKEGKLTQGDINSMQLFLREYREFRNQERADFGDDAKRIDGRIQIGFGAAPQDSVMQSITQQSFKQFVSENMDKVDRKLIEAQATPQETLTKLAEEILLKTDVLDTLHEEDLALVRQEQEAKNNK